MIMDKSTLDSLQRVATEVVATVPYSSLKDCLRSRNNVVPPVRFVVDGLNLKVVVDAYRHASKGTNIKKVYVTMRLAGVPDSAEVLVTGSVLKFLQVENSTTSGSSNEDSVDSEEDCSDEFPGSKGKVRKFEVMVSGNGIFVKLAVAGTQEIVARLTVTHVRKLGACLNVARCSGTLCDVVLRAAGKDFPAHKVVLSAASPVFLRMFTGNFVEATGVGSGGKEAGTPAVVDVQEVISAVAFEKLLEFLYTGDVVAFDDQEVELLGLADRYMVDKLRTVCIHRLLVVKKPRVVATLRAAVERPYIPKEVLEQTTKTMLNDWDALSLTTCWAEFQTAHPVGAMLLSAAQKAFKEACEASDDDE